MAVSRFGTSSQALIRRPAAAETGSGPLHLGRRSDRGRIVVAGLPPHSILSTTAPVVRDSATAVRQPRFSMSVWIAGRRAQGRCRCPQGRLDINPKTGQRFSMCRTCLDRVTAYSIERERLHGNRCRQQRRARGECTDCGVPVKRYRRCLGCRQKHSVARKQVA
jgi:hypothetical protein